MKKRIFSIVISFVMILSLSISPAFGETNDWWTEERANIIKEVGLEIEKFIESKSADVKIVTSDRFQENLNETKIMLESDFDYFSIQGALSNFLNQSLSESDGEIRKQLISNAQDYNATRSNKPTSEAFIDDEGNPDINQEKAQDYNSSRSNKPNTEIFIDDEDSDDDLIEDGIDLEIRIPIDKDNLILIENISLDEIKFNSSNNSDLILAMIFVDSIQSSIEESEMVESCDLNNNKIAFYFQNGEKINNIYLQDEFFIPLAIYGSGDCDDGDPDIKPGGEDPDSDDDYIGDVDEDDKLIFKIGNENVISGNIQKVLEVSPFIQNSRTMVPFRFIGEELGAGIEWKAEERKVEYKLGDKVVELWIGQNIAKINGEEVMLDEDPEIRPFIVNSRTVVPVRFISEALGFEVIWNEETKEIMIVGNPLYESDTVGGDNPLYNE